MIDKLIASIRHASNCDTNTQVTPVCILWTDKESQWLKTIPVLQQQMPELLVLGDYSPESRTGTAVWLRCALAGKMEGFEISEKFLPVLYLPGVGRQELRAVDSCLDYLKPLAELQYRGTIWSQTNGKDWTTLAFFMSKQGGLGLQVAQDSETVDTLKSNMHRLLTEDISILKNEMITANFLQSKIVPDFYKQVLRWMSEGSDYQKSLPEEEWKAFVKLCHSKLSLDPVNDSSISAAGKLMQRQGEWAQVWARFEESYLHFKNLYPILKQVVPYLTDDPTIFPLANEQAEQNLKYELSKLSSHSAPEARIAILELEKEHGRRRSGVWADMGESSLAQSLKSLNVLAEITAKPIGGSISDMYKYYIKVAWRADSAVIEALSITEKIEDRQSVNAAISSIYLPWLDDSAKNLQQAIRDEGYPVAAKLSDLDMSSTCLFFVDGLRYDVAQTLAEKLSIQGYAVQQKPYWAALPTVTATGKPAIMLPLRDQLIGDTYNSDFLPQVKSGGQQANSDKLEHMLDMLDWQLLDQTNVGTGAGLSWYIAGDIDSTGHNSGANLPQQIPTYIDQIVQHISRLLFAGWKIIHIVTDHGWLLMPGGLPKANLPTALTDSKWGRCATIKEGAIFDGNQYPWFWNQYKQVAIPEGIHCYKKGMEYAHGGISLQECLLTELIVENGISSTLYSATINQITWKRMRCYVTIEGPRHELTIDIRTAPANANTSIISNLKTIGEDDILSLIVTDDEMEGKSAYVVLLSNDKVVAQKETIIGGEE